MKKNTTIHMDNKFVVLLKEGEEEKVLKALYSDKRFVTVLDEYNNRFILNTDHIICIKEGIAQ